MDERHTEAEQLDTQSGGNVVPRVPPVFQDTNSASPPNSMPSINITTDTISWFGFIFQEVIAETEPGWMKLKLGLSGLKLNLAEGMTLPKSLPVCTLLTMPLL
jgi:hypothetical protein